MAKIGIIPNRNDDGKFFFKLFPQQQITGIWKMLSQKNMIAAEISVRLLSFGFQNSTIVGLQTPKPLLSGSNVSRAITIDDLKYLVEQN